MATTPMSRLTSRERRENRDIKAPDGFLLGGLRVVRTGGVVKMNGWWQHDDLKNLIGEYVWVFVMDGWATAAEFAPPGLHIYEAQSLKMTKTLNSFDHHTNQYDSELTRRKERT